MKDHPYEEFDETIMTFFDFNHELNAQKTRIVNPQGYFL